MPVDFVFIMPALMLAQALSLVLCAAAVCVFGACRCTACTSQAGRVVNGAGFSGAEGLRFLSFPLNNTAVEVQSHSLPNRAIFKYGLVFSVWASRLCAFARVRFSCDRAKMQRREGLVKERVQPSRTSGRSVLHTQYDRLSNRDHRHPPRS